MTRPVPSFATTYIRTRRPCITYQSQTNIPYTHTGSGGGDKVTQFSELYNMITQIYSIDLK